MIRSFTVETRLELKSNRELENYLNDFVTVYSQVYREMWQEMTSPQHREKFSKRSFYITFICNKHHLLKRTVNAIYNEIEGRKKSLMELMKVQRDDLKNLISDLKRRKEKLGEEINKLKQKARENKATERQLKIYRNNKTKYYHLCNRLNKKQMHLKNLEKKIKEKKYSIGFGSRKLFRSQYLLEENGFKNHLKWYSEYRRRRDANIYYLGSGDETMGNQLCQMRYEKTTGRFNIKLRKENQYCPTAGDKYLMIENLNFSHLHDELACVCLSYEEDGKGISPLSYRFHRKDGRWYLQVIFRNEVVNYLTTAFNGVIGLDYNNGFIEAAITSRDGNLVGLRHYPLKYHGAGNKANSELQEAVSKIVRFAVEEGKDIVIEELNFKVKRAMSNKGKNREYNRMIHAFDYHRYRFLIENACHRKRTELKIIDPAYTSMTGKNKYSEKKKLSVHQAAAYVIARKGQGYMDRL